MIKKKIYELKKWWESIFTLNNEFNIYEYDVRDYFDYTHGVFKGEKKITTIIDLASDKLLTVMGESYILTGFLSAGSGLSVKIYNGNTLVDTVTTDNNGAFSKTITANATGVQNYRAVFEGNDTYREATSNNVSIKNFVVGDNYMELGITGNSFRSYHISATPIEYSGEIIVDWGDNTFEEYTGGRLTHNYKNSDDYTIKIYGNITTLKANFFMHCDNLNYIIIPNTVTTIRYGCFEGCSSLTSITLPDSVTTIEDNCFRNCTSLTNIEIPDSVTNIGQSCFYGCTSLTSINIPYGAYVNKHCFHMCSSLTEIVMDGTDFDSISSYDSDWIYGCTSFVCFLVPKGTESSYIARGYPSDLIKENANTLILVGSKEILSFVDGDECVLTATVLDNKDNPIPNASVELYKDNVLWDTLTTDNNGECSKTYTADGRSADVKFEAKSMYLKESYRVEDCVYWNDGTKTTGLIVDDGVSATIDDGALKITTNTSGEKYVRLPVSLSNSDNFFFEFEVARSGTNQHFACYVNTPSTSSGLWWAYDISTSKYVGGLTGTSLEQSQSISVGDVFKYNQKNGVIGLFRNSLNWKTKSTNFPTSPFGLGFYTNAGRVQYLKNIKVMRYKQKLK